MFKEPTHLGRMSLEAHQDSRRWFPDTADNLFFMTACMGGEAGEAVNELKKVFRLQRSLTPVEKHKYVMELTDVLTYLLGCYAIVGADPERAYYQKRLENEQRFGKVIE